MTNVHHRPLRLRNQAIQFGLVAVLAFETCLCASPETQGINTNANWLPLKELLEKWRGVSLEQVQAQAETGNPLAQHYLGYCYTEGLRIAPDPQLGANWYRRALTNGYLPSANNLGFAYQRGLLGSDNVNRAVNYYTYAAERGLTASKYNLGVLYRDGIGVQENASEALHWFHLAAEEGDPEAMSEIGRAYGLGLGVDTNLVEAERWFKKATDMGNARAEFNLGLLYKGEGRGGEAIQLYQRAAGQGNADAMTELYVCFWEGTGVATDHPKALQWLSKAADAGDPRAQYLMGYQCEHPDPGNTSAGHPSIPDLIGAFQWYGRSAEQNWTTSQYHLGLSYLEGKGVAPDQEHGLELVRTAADKGLDEAMIELANLYAHGVGAPRSEQDRPMQLLTRGKAWGKLVFRYEYGLGTERDMVAVAQCYCRLATGKSWYYSPDWLVDKIEFKPTKRLLGITIEFNVGRVQIYGPLHESSSEPTDAALRYLSLYLKSALGDNQSALEIANCYLVGKDEPRSMPDAWLWFTLAAQNGSGEATVQSHRLESQMDSEVIGQARQQSADFLQKLNQLSVILRAHGGAL